MGPFEPPQPKGSVYVAPSPNSMGVLLLPIKKKKVTPNPVFDALQIVYTPAEDGAGGDEGDLALTDPSNVKVAFQSAPNFEATEAPQALWSTAPP